MNERMVLHGVPFGSYFRIQFRYEIEKSSVGPWSCKCDVYIGVLWLKSNKILEQVERETLLASN